MITYFKNQKTLAEALKSIIDSYWSHKIDEDSLINQVNEIILKNKEMIYSNDNYSSTIKQRLGKRRLELLKKISNHAEVK